MTSATYSGSVDRHRLVQTEQVEHGPRPVLRDSQLPSNTPALGAEHEAHCAAWRRSVLHRGDTCPAVIRLDDDPDQLYVIVKPATDPSAIAALSPRVGPGEILAVVPATLLPEVQ